MIKSGIESVAVLLWSFTAGGIAHLWIHIQYNSQVRRGWLCWRTRVHWNTGNQIASTACARWLGDRPEASSRGGWRLAGQWLAGFGTGWMLVGLVPAAGRLVASMSDSSWPGSGCVGSIRTGGADRKSTSSCRRLPRGWLHSPSREPGSTLR